MNSGRGLHGRVLRLHSEEYRRPTDLPDGPVLVVGAANSGAEIAVEVARHRPTAVAISKRFPQAPERYRDPPDVAGRPYPRHDLRRGDEDAVVPAVAASDDRFVSARFLLWINGHARNVVRDLTQQLVDGTI